MAMQESTGAPPAYEPADANTNINVPPTAMQDLEANHNGSLEKDLRNGSPQPPPPQTAAVPAVPAAAAINPRLLTTPAVALAQLDETPQCIDCPHCGARTLTRVEQHSSGQTGAVALLCCLLLGVVGACIPYCCQLYYDADRYCQACGRQVVHKPHDGPPQLCVPRPSNMPAPVPAAHVVVVQGKGEAAVVG